MAYLGLRCWPDRFTYVVLSGTVSSPVVVTSGAVTIPADVDRPAFLNWISTEVKTLLKRHTPTHCSYKAVEPLARKNSNLLRRSQVEGVVQAVVYESGCHEIASFTKQQLKACLRFEGTAKDVAEALDASPLREFSGTDCEESALAAWASLPD
jgi:Holliday junction resolvasome RuvABC endonuclease subunit